MLSAGQPARARRMLSAAEASCDGGRAPPGPGHAGRGGRVSRPPPPRPGRSGCRAGSGTPCARPADATAALLGAAAELGPVDVRLARDILVEAVVQAQINGQLAPDGDDPRATWPGSPESLPLPPGTPATVGDLLLDADTTLQLQGLQAAAPLLRQAIERRPGTRPERPRRPSGGWRRPARTRRSWPTTSPLHELAWRMEAEAREQGAVIALSLALSHAGVSELLAGLLSEAERCFLERVAIEEARGQRLEHRPAARGGLAGPGRAGADPAGHGGGGSRPARPGLPAGVRRLRPLRPRTRAGPVRRRPTPASPRASRTARRSSSCCPISSRRPSGPATTTPPSRCGQLAGLAEASPVPRTLGFLARARALLPGDAPEAEPHYQAAIAQHSQTRGPAHRARSQLVYGEWLRRARRPRDAREQLRTAYRGFGEMGARASRPAPGWSCPPPGESVGSGRPPR